LRQRVVAHVAEGNTHRSTAARFRVLVKFVNDMVKLMKATWGLVPKAQGNGGGHSKLSSLKDWVARRIAEKPDLRECHELCVSGSAHAGFRYSYALKRSSNMISNWFRAANHSRTFLPPFSKLRI